MPAYVIATIDNVTDPNKIAQYRELAQKAVAKAGGRYIARGGETFPLEGGWETGRAVILEFPSLDAIKAWYQSPEYHEALAARSGAADFKLLAVDGL